MPQPGKNALEAYEIEITSEGRSGDVIYQEPAAGGGALKFWWEFSTTGAYVSIPPDDVWDRFCESSGAEWAKGRKAEIAARIAEETKRRQCPSAGVEIEDEWINFYF